ncbi:MAG: response regulator [Planctomycetota bacterium]
MTPTPHPPGRRVLIIDDEVHMVTILSKLLQRDGCTVSTLTNGRHALQCVATFKPDLILMDLLMPDVNGINLLRSLRPAYAHIPVIVITGVAREGMLQEAALAGATRIVTKPFALEEVQAVLREYLATPSSPETLHGA